MSISLADRAKFIGLSQVRLAELSGLDKHTVGRVLSGDRNVLRTSESALVATLEAEERRVLAHLLALHTPEPLRGANVDGRVDPRIKSGDGHDGVVNGLAA